MAVVRSKPPSARMLKRIGEVNSRLREVNDRKIGLALEARELKVPLERVAELAHVPKTFVQQWEQDAQERGHIPPARERLVLALEQLRNSQRLVTELAERQDEILLEAEAAGATGVDIGRGLGIRPDTALRRLRHSRQQRGLIGMRHQARRAIDLDPESRAKFEARIAEILGRMRTIELELQLADESRWSLVLAVREMGLSYAAIAAELGSNPEHVRSRIIALSELRPQEQSAPDNARDQGWWIAQTIERLGDCLVETQLLVDQQRLIARQAHSRGVARKKIRELMGLSRGVVDEWLQSPRHVGGEAAVAKKAAEVAKAKEERATKVTQRRRARDIARKQQARQMAALEALREVDAQIEEAIERRSLLALQAVETGLNVATISDGLHSNKTAVGKWVSHARRVREDE